MDPTMWQRVKDVLDQVADAPSARRRTMIDRLCGDDGGLRAEVLGFLELDDQVDDFIASPLWRVLPGEEEVPDAKVPADVAPRRIGHYRLEHKLGEGGMGEVYLAVREDDYEQKVAIKRSLASVWNDELQTRFVTERQILARLEHPGIARLLDGGTDEEGLPYLVMEYVDGEPIDTFCDRHAIDLRQRLRLMSKVCRIVHHAHKRLIVHRDLKPSNIMVTTDRQPRLLDFGIAKLLDPALDAATTARGKAVLTPACASPEQIMGEPLTTACDVYALGVLLYRLLTGRQPYELSGLSFGEIRRIVCLRAVERPSQRVARDTARRNKNPDTLSIRIDEIRSPDEPVASPRRLRGDLDAIVLMAMRKEAEHRYGSAAEMADDIDRYLDGLPVQARKGNWSYHAGKHIRRNKPVVALMLLIIALAVTSMVLGFQAGQARDEAVEAQISAESLKDVLVGILKAPDPDEAQGRDVTVREVLVNARPTIEQDLAEQPELLAEMLDLMGVVFTQLGDGENALDLFQAAVTKRREYDPRPDTKLANMTANVGSAHYNLRDYAAAEEKHREALDLHELSGSDLLIVATTLYNLTNSRVQLGQRREAKEDYLRVLELRRTNGAPPRAIADSLHSVGHNSLIVGDPESALPALDEALRLHRSLAEDGPTLSIAKVAKTFARARHAAGQLHEAQALYEEAIRIRSLLRGSGHQSVHELEPHMARLLIDLGELDRAEVLARRYLDWAVANRPPEHFDIVVARSIQGAHRLRESPDPQAEDDVRAGIEALDERFGSEAFVTVWTRRQLERLE